MCKLHFDRDFESARADAARLQGLRERLVRRASMMAALRRWFASEGFLEVESSVRIPDPALEDYIDAVEFSCRSVRRRPSRIFCTRA